MAKKTIPPSKPLGYIYLVSCDAVSGVKIGYSGNPYKRLRGLQTGAPGILRLESTWLATQSDESQIHRLLSTLNRHLEWFDISVSNAVDFISTTLGAAPVPVLTTSDLAQIVPRFFSKWQTFRVDDLFDILSDAYDLLTRMFDFNALNSRTDISYARRAIQKIQSYEQPLDPMDVALKLSDAIGRVKSLQEHHDYYISVNASAIEQVLSAMRDEVWKFID